MIKAVHRQQRPTTFCLMHIHRGWTSSEACSNILLVDWCFTFRLLDVLKAMAEPIRALCVELIKAVNVMMEAESSQTYRLEALKVNFPLSNTIKRLLCMYWYVNPYYGGHIWIHFFLENIVFISFMFIQTIKSYLILFMFMFLCVTL